MEKNNRWICKGNDNLISDCLSKVNKIEYKNINFYDNKIIQEIQKENIRDIIRESCMIDKESGIYMKGNLIYILKQYNKEMI